MPDNQNNSVEVQEAVTAALNEQKKKKRKKRLIFLAIIVVLVIGIIAIAGSGGDSKGPKVEKVTQSSDNKSTEPAESTEGTDAAVPDVIEAGTAITDDWYKITYVSCDPDYKGYDKYSSPEKGNKVIRAVFLIENISQSDNSIGGMDCYADGNKCESFIFGADDYNSPTLETISPGRKFKGIVYYEVPADAKEIEIEMEIDFWDEEKLVFAIK